MSKNSKSTDASSTPSSSVATSNLTVRRVEINSPEQMETARREAEEEALKGRSSITFVEGTMSQERVNALMNRLVRQAATNGGSEAAEEVRKIMGNAMVETFGDAGSDNEGHSSDEEAERHERILRERTGGRGGNGGRGNGGGRG